MTEFAYKQRINTEAFEAGWDRIWGTCEWEVVAYPILSSHCTGLRPGSFDVGTRGEPVEGKPCPYCGKRVVFT